MGYEILGLRWNVQSPLPPHRLETALVWMVPATEKAIHEIT